jgi:transcription initiation factor TFIIF subunit alpha
MAAPSGSQPSTSRATSPAASSLGGHSVVAKRATGPKLSRPKLSAGSRATSPLAGGGLSSWATSPSTSRAGSPPVAGSKRKADDASSDSGTPVSKPKKAKSDAKSNAASMAREVTLPEIVEWFEKHPNSTTKDCSQAFRPFLGDDARRKRFITKTKSVVISRDGYLSLRPGKFAVRWFGFLLLIPHHRRTSTCGHAACSLGPIARVNLFRIPWFTTYWARFSEQGDRKCM